MENPINDPRRPKYHTKKVQPVKGRAADTRYNFPRWNQFQRATILKKRKTPAPKPRKQQSRLKTELQKHPRPVIWKLQQKSSMKKSQSDIFAQHQSIGMKEAASTGDIRMLNEQKLSVNARNHKLELASRNKSLNYWRKKEENKIVNSVKSFLSNILQRDTGCKCGDPCPWGASLFQWTQYGEAEARGKYLQIAEIMIMRSLSNDSYQEVELDKNLRQIKKDINRTRPTHATFRNPQFLISMERILNCYAVKDREIGYVQGMNMILSGIIFHVKDEPKSFFVFKKIMQDVRQIYLNDFRECYQHISVVERLCKTYINDLHEHFMDIDLDMTLICFPWILSLTTGLVKLQHTYLIYDGFVKDKWLFIYKLCLAIFLYFKQDLKEMNEAGDIMVMLSSNNQQTYNLNWKDLVEYAHTLKITIDPLQAQI